MPNPTYYSTSNIQSVLHITHPHYLSEAPCSGAFEKLERWYESGSFRPYESWVVAGGYNDDIHYLVLSVVYSPSVRYLILVYNHPEVGWMIWDKLFYANDTGERFELLLEQTDADGLLGIFFAEDE